MKSFLTFDDVLIVPKFSNIESRSQVDLSTDLNGLELSLPIISANMDTVTEADMCEAMSKAGGIGCYHRFYKGGFNKPNVPYIYSFGLGDSEQQRVDYMHDSGHRLFCLDVAHGAQQQVVDCASRFKKNYPNAWLMVGNFASAESLQEFLKRCGGYRPNCVKVGIGGGSACITRQKTGVGIPQLNAVMECGVIASAFNVSMISDGGHRTSGDIAKALAAGADAVMLGGMLAGTDETPGEIITVTDTVLKYSEYNDTTRPRTVKVGQFKVYRGSASKDSYADQNKDWSTAEGESFKVPYKGSASSILEDIKGGLKSAFSYVGAMNLVEFQNNANFIQVTSSSTQEGVAHGKTNR